MAFEPVSEDQLGKRKRIDADEDDEEVPKSHVEQQNDPTSDEGEDDSDGADETDEDGSDDDEEGISGECEYFEDTEKFPRCVAYDKDFLQVGIDLVSIPKEPMALIDQNGCASQRVSSCRENAKELTSIPLAKREKACLLGTTGAGKSSLINSLLGLPNLAKAISGGEACTCVATEYQCSFPGQTKQLAAKIEYFGLDEIESLFLRHIEDYYRWNFKHEPDWSDDEKQEYRRLSTTALVSFRSLFCDKVEMISQSAAEDFLRGCYYAPDKEAVNSFMNWSQALLEEKEADGSDGIESRTEYIDADTQEELIEQLNPLVSSNSRFEIPTLWPIVKKVRIGIKGPRILDYIVLVDLPGLDDTNQVRVNASYETMRSCDSVWVVTKIDRAISDTTVDALLMRYGRDYDMIVVCTGIDANIRPALANYLESQGQSVGNHDELFAQEKGLRKQVKRLSRKIDSRQARLEGRTKSRTKKKPRPLTEKTRNKLDTEVSHLQEYLKAAEEELPKVTQERFELLVDARNANAIRRLQEEKRDYLPKDNILKVWCVSNSHYMSLKGAEVVTGPRLDPVMTGIPALREYVLECAAPQLLQSMEHFINHSFEVFMQGIAMWAKSYSVEGGAELLATVEKPQKHIAPILQSYVDQTIQANKEINIEPLVERQAKLVKEANRVLEKKKVYHWSTARAFIRKDGNHKTSVVPQESWNEQFLESANKTILKQWSCFIDKQDSLSQEMARSLMDLIEGIGQAVMNKVSPSSFGNILTQSTEAPARMILPMDRVKETLRAQLDGIRQAVAEHQDALKKDLRNIKLDTIQDRPTSYFSQAMTEAYKQCKDDSGSGIKERTFSTFKTHLTLAGSRSPFAIVCKKLSSAISKDAKAKNKSLHRKVEKILKDIHRQFDDMVDEKIDDPSEAKLREEFRTFLGPAEQKFDEIKADLGRIKRRYK